MDEAVLQLDPVLRKCWMKKGKQHRVPLPEKSRQSQRIFAGYNWRKDTVAWHLPERHDSQGFVTWLEHLMLEYYPTQFVVLVMDNASIHHSLMSRAALTLFEYRLLAVYLPAYTPNLNPIERYWRHLKDRVCANKLYNNLNALRDAVVKELTLQNDLDYELRFQTCK